MPEAADQPVTHQEKALSPVRWLRDAPKASVDPQAIGLCLSGGGYRAMLFHVGALWRLNELGYLPKLTHVSSVSGGSITAAVLGMNWEELAWDARGQATNFDEKVVAPIRGLARETIDVRAGVVGLLTPRSINRCLAAAYDRRLFKKKKIFDALPPAKTSSPAEPQAGPAFVINSTDLQTGTLWRFSQDSAFDEGAGTAGQASLATAVAASSAFPPILGPARMPSSTLVDGGVYDNLGLAPVWTTCGTALISDAGGAFHAEEGSLFGFERWRWRDWGTQSMRVLKTIDRQVRDLRKHQAVAGFEELKGRPEYHEGAYWGIRSHIADYKLPDALDFDADVALGLAKTATRLAALPECRQEGLINWGYVICDTAMRAHVVEGEARPQALPYRRSCRRAAC